MIVPAVLIALLTIGTNTFTDAIARVAIGVDRRPEEAVLLDELTRTVAVTGGLTRAGPGPAPPAGDGDAAGVRLEVRDLEIRIGASGPDVVSDVSFAVPGRRGARPGRRVGLGQDHRGARPARPRPPGAADQRRRGPPRRDRPAAAAARATCAALRGARVAYVPAGPGGRAQPDAAGGHPAARGAQGPPAARSTTRATGCSRSCARSASTPRPEMLRRYPHQLSGGQQQRIALAMAFACRPSLIVLDEPTTGLDVSTQRHVLDTVRSLCRSYGVAAVYVSHDLAVVGGLVVRGGGHVRRADRRDRRHGQGCSASRCIPYTRGLLAAVPSPRAGRGADRHRRPAAAARPPRAGCSFAARCGFAVSECLQRPPEPVLTDGRAVRCIRVTQIRSAGTGRPAAVTVRARRRPGRDAVAARGVRPLRARAGAVRRRARRATRVVRGGRRRVRLGEDDARPLHRRPAQRLDRRDHLRRATAGPRRPRTGPGRRLRRVQYIFQNPYTSLNPRKTVGQIVAQPLEQLLGLPYRERTERAARVLEDVSLGSDFAGRYPDQLSGGERQRVAIARALVVEPDLLVCDEVTSALDVSVQAVIVEVLRRLQRERHLAMIFITHNLALVRSIAQSAVVLRDGAVVEAGPVEQILEHPADPYTIRLIADVPKLATPGEQREAGGAAAAGAAAP